MKVNLHPFLKQLVLIMLLLSAIGTYAQNKPAEPAVGEMKEYFFVLLKRGPNRNQDKESVAKLQTAHIAHLDKMAADGKLSIAGPFGDEGDWRGILIFKTQTIAEAKALVEQDPMVKIGRLAYEIHPWWSMKGAKLD